MEASLPRRPHLLLPHSFSRFPTRSTSCLSAFWMSDWRGRPTGTEMKERAKRIDNFHSDDSKAAWPVAPGIWYGRLGVIPESRNRLWSSRLPNCFSVGLGLEIRFPYYLCHAFCRVEGCLETTRFEWRNLLKAPHQPGVSPLQLVHHHPASLLPRLPILAPRLSRNA